jgi:putative ABC transport system substrate-binding protein
VIGYLSALSESQIPNLIEALRRGLSENGFVEGTSVIIDYRFAEGEYGRLQTFATEFVRQPVSLIIAVGPPAAFAAKVVTTSIPIVFSVGLDPVAAGLVTSFNHPGGNATGVSLITGPLGQKRLELLRELASKASTIAMLINPVSPDAVPEIRDVEQAAQANGLGLKILNASTPAEIDRAFTEIAESKPDALLVGSDPFYVLHRKQITSGVAPLRIPAIYPFREFVAAGGLLSYGASLVGAQRQVGIYAGRILKGAKVADLPVLQPTTFELVLNLKTAKAQGIEVPPMLHARTDEVIE